ncbi:MAG: leucine-rich repeat domain-containing protein [Promethearchaeota archaeon]
MTLFQQLAEGFKPSAELLEFAAHSMAKTKVFPTLIEALNYKVDSCIPLIKAKIFSSDENAHLQSTQMKLSTVNLLLYWYCQRWLPPIPDFNSRIKQEGVAVHPTQDGSQDPVFGRFSPDMGILGCPPPQELLGRLQNYLQMTLGMMRPPGGRIMMNFLHGVGPITGQEGPVHQVMNGLDAASARLAKQELGLEGATNEQIAGKIYTLGTLLIHYWVMKHWFQPPLPECPGEVDLDRGKSGSFFDTYGHRFSLISLKWFLKEAQLEIPKNDSKKAMIELLDKHQDQVRVIELSRIGLSEIPESIGEFQNLESFTMIDAHDVTTIPASFKKLTKLKRLLISESQIIHIPDFLWQLPLTSLSLSQAKIAKIPPDICQLTKLEFLSLSNNQITQVPDCIGQLKQLKTLSLLANPLTKIPESIGNLTNLRNLTLSSCPLTHLPESIGKCREITEISLFSTNITRLPKGAYQWKKLRRLTISNTPLTTLSPAIKNWQNLEWLDISRSKISKLPNTIKKLKKIQTLQISYTPIEEIPKGLIEALPDLRLFSCGHTPGNNKGNFHHYNRALRNFKS